MIRKSLGVAATALLCGAALLTACDKSRQTADGTTQPGDAGTAVTANGTIAATGSPEQGGANATPADKGVEGGMSTSTTGTPNTVPPAVANSQ
jgi:hypothetical protein